MATNFFLFDQLVVLSSVRDLRTAHVFPRPEGVLMETFAFPGLPRHPQLLGPIVREDTGLRLVHQPSTRRPCLVSRSSPLF